MQNYEGRMTTDMSAMSAVEEEENSRKHTVRDNIKNLKPIVEQQLYKEYFSNNSKT